MTYLSVTVLLVVLALLAYLLDNDKKHAQAAALREGDNLVRAFAQSVSRSLTSADQTLRLLRRTLLQDPAHADLSAWTTDIRLNNELTFEFSRADRDGVIRDSTVGAAVGANIAEREEFRVQVDATEDRLFISKPAISKITGQLAVKLTRRLVAPDGSFDGVLCMSADILQFEKLYLTLPLGEDGVVSLMGLDGVVRARGSEGRTRWDVIGRAFPNAQVLKALADSDQGHYWTERGARAQGIDTVKRLLFYRKVEDFPLVVTVGLSEAEVFRHADQNARIYAGIALLLTCAALIAILAGALRERRLLATRADLERANERFNAALQNISYGLSMFDREQRLLVCNEPFRNMYGLRPGQIAPGTTLQSVLEAVAAANGLDGTLTWSEALPAQDATPADLAQRYVELPDGRVIKIRRQLMQGGGWIATHEDITDRRASEKRAEAAYRELAQQQYAIDQAVTVTMTDAHGSITYANDKFSQISGYSSEELIGRDHRILNSGTHPKEFFGDMYACLGRGEVWRGEICNRAKNGSLYWVDSTIVPRLGDHGRPIAYTAIRIDITARKRAERQIVHMARHDTLTGIANRPVLLEEMDKALARARRHGETFAVLMLDLDRFKNVNDTLGHPAGDELLKEMAARLSGVLRDTDVLARLGGDEFAIIQDHESNQHEAAIALAHRIMDAVEQPFDLLGRRVTVGTSIGIALAPHDGTSSDDLLKKADLALYRVKSESRGNYKFFNAAMIVAATARHETEIELREALAHDQLELHYQPVIDVRTGRAEGVEALVRWRHPTKGLVPPGQFIPIAEETGIIEQVGAWVLDRACRDAVQWPDHVKVAVNLSAKQFRKGNLFELVLCALVESGLRPGRLELEITETVVLQDDADYRGVIQQLKNIGVSIAIDDFGTGYSSLSYLTMFPFDKIKIDRSFTQGLAHRADCAAVVSAVVTLARSLDVVVTAEGVETREEFELLRVAGVQFVQGYLFGRPVEARHLDLHSLETAAKTTMAA